MGRYVVESPAYNAKGERCGTFRVYVATASRAAAIASEHPERTWRRVESTNESALSEPDQAAGMAKKVA